MIKRIVIIVSFIVAIGVSFFAGTIAFEVVPPAEITDTAFLEVLDELMENAREEMFNLRFQNASARRFSRMKKWAS